MPNADERHAQNRNTRDAIVNNSKEKQRGGHAERTKPNCPTEGLTGEKSVQAMGNKGRPRFRCQTDGRRGH